MNRPFEHFQVITKPSGSVCNLDCTYCFYLEKERLYPDRKNHWKMDDATLEAFVRQYIQADRSGVVEFIWQGGEPTLMGIDYFEKALALQQRYRGGRQINNSLQTNGILLDDRWARFLKKHHFLVGISLDGDRVSNDRWRQTRAGKSSYPQVLAGIRVLKQHGVEFNTLTVVNAENVRRPLETYQALKRAGSRYIQFIPLVERAASRPGPDGLTLISPDFTGQSEVTPWSVPAQAYGRFLNRIFDHWRLHDMGQVFVMNFEQTLTQRAGGQGSCVTAPTCGANPVMEANGDVYSCDHFVYPQYRLGNIHHADLRDLINAEQNIRFGQQKLRHPDPDCLRCTFRPLCHGGCPKHRFEPAVNGMPNKNYLCAGYKEYLRHCLPSMDIILSLLNSGRSPEKIKRYFRQHTA